MQDMQNNKKDVNGFHWIRNPEQKGEHLFTFDDKHIFNLFRDYPNALTKEEKEQFDKLNPFWADFFKHRSE